MRFVNIFMALVAAAASLERCSSFVTSLLSSSSCRHTTFGTNRGKISMQSHPPNMSGYEDVFRVQQRKMYEIKKFKKQHPPNDTADPLNQAMGYIAETRGEMRLGRALRRVHDDPENPANIDFVEKTEEEMDIEAEKVPKKKGRYMYDPSIAGRRGSFTVDIKRKSWSRPGETLCNFDDAGMVAEAMVNIGADAVFVNMDYNLYGGDITELRAAVKSVRKVSRTAAVVMKDIVVDTIQLGIAKEAGCDGVVLMASVLGEKLEMFLNQCSIMGLEAIVEVHTPNEVEAAIEMLVTYFLVTNFDRITGEYHPGQAEMLAGMFPGTGPLITIATGGIESPEDARRLLRAGYDGVVVGKAVMGSSMAPDFVAMVRDRALLPAQVGDLGVDDLDIETADLEELIRQQNEDFETSIQDEPNSFQ